jgi:eukaryotic-like serine/threonine-protein kinase
VSAEIGNLVGAVLSQRFRLVKCIGIGGMGTVYATDALGEGGVPLAVKILNAECLDNAEIVTRFIDEGKACQNLKHPNIVRVFEVAVAENGAPYIVMEMLRGVPLSTYTATGTRVPVAQAHAILQGILTALGVAHGNGIVHRDLKPENVFLAQERGSFQVKLLDFGIAKVMEAAGGMGSRTKTGALLGTPAYMSPEQILQPKDVDPRSDLFSVGVLAYEMLTGRPAFPAPTEYAKLAAVLNTTPVPLDSADPSLTVLRPVIERAMQKSRDTRFSSASEMAAAFKAVVSATAHDTDTGVVRFSQLPEPPVYSIDVPGTARTAMTPHPVSAAVIPNKVTLTSRPSAASLPPVRPQHAHPLGVSGETLPSGGIPILTPRTGSTSVVPILGEGVSPTKVAGLCLVSALVGLVLGFLIGRS